MSIAFRVGSLIVGTLLILSTGILLIGNKDFLFSSMYRLKADFPNVAGLNNGAAVRLGGTPVGTVKEIDLPSQPDGKVTVVMMLKDSTRNLIRKDSVASIKTEGLLGDAYVEISFGSQQAENVQSGDTLSGEIPTSIADVSKDVSKDVAGITAKTEAAAAAFQDNMDALKHNFFLRGFFRKRGYNDPSELTKDAINQLPAGTPSKEFDYDGKRLFGSKPNSAKLEDQRALKEAGEFLAQNKFRLAVVAAGETTGDTAEDKVMTEARAKVVRDYLAQNFQLDDTRIKTIGLGKSKKIDDKSAVQILVYDVRPAAGNAESNRD